jgi:hypothetical protein
MAGDALVGTNMYAYCSNNPVMYVDPSGHASRFGEGFAKFFKGLGYIGLLYVIGVSYDLIQMLAAGSFETLADIAISLFDFTNNKATDVVIHVDTTLLDKDVCSELGELYAPGSGLTAEIIAKEIYFHAYFYYNFDTLKSDDLILSKFGEDRLNDWYSRSNPISLGNDNLIRRLAFNYFWIYY